jgi:hypothetical protein
MAVTVHLRTPDAKQICGNLRRAEVLHNVNWDHSAILNRTEDLRPAENEWK